MALTPNNFPAALEEIKRLGEENKSLQLELKKLKEKLKPAPKKKGLGQKTSESTTQDKS